MNQNPQKTTYPQSELEKKSYKKEFPDYANRSLSSKRTKNLPFHS